MSPAEKEARQMIADKKMQAATERAIQQSRRLGPNEDEKQSGIERLGRMLKQKMNPAPEPMVDQMGNQAGMAKGGKVGSASRRADGIAQRGKTRGTIC